VKRQQQEELARTVQRKDQEIVASNHDILESHAALTDELASLRAEHTKLTLEQEEARASLDHFKGRTEQGERLLVEKEGVVKRLSAEGERYRVALREL
jgi:3-dehydroquinate dehydratase